MYSYYIYIEPPLAKTLPKYLWMGLDPIWHIYNIVHNKVCWRDKHECNWPFSPFWHPLQLLRQPINWVLLCKVTSQGREVPVINQIIWTIHLAMCITGSSKDKGFFLSHKKKLFWLLPPSKLTPQQEFFSGRLPLLHISWRPLKKFPRFNSTKNVKIHAWHYRRRSISA